MKSLKYTGFFLAATLTWCSTTTAQELSTSLELDLFWAEIARTVREGDFESYRSSYHPDAVLVSNLSNSSKPIAEALADWQSGFTQTREGKNSVSLEFRFTRRIHDPTTAHESGIFRYASTAEDGQTNVTYMHFQALLIKQGVWKTLMEYQTGPATAEEWDAAG